MIKEVELDKIIELESKLQDKRVKLRRSYGRVTDYVITGTHNGTTYVAVVPYSPKIKIGDSVRLDENGLPYNEAEVEGNKSRYYSDPTPKGFGDAMSGRYDRLLDQILPYPKLVGVSNKYFIRV